jgi:glycosyltransferase involved in cell wall biosynthesis
MVDPFDKEAIAEAIGRVVDDAGLRHDLRELGFERARKFDWLETARLTIRAYERAVESGRRRGLRRRR